ncbi:MAG: DUF4087 domain-containing protein [Tabrizicola sp.]|nr:DUF4087 domain-containing protein [Tabrizicola sp.]
MLRPFLLAATLLAALPAQAETLRRCGWFHNPTPANLQLRDADGRWWVQMQGSPAAPGFEPAYERANGGAQEWVRENVGDYGYGCACIDGEFGPVGSTDVLSVKRFTPLPLATCRQDPALPAP